MEKIHLFKLKLTLAMSLMFGVMLFSTNNVGFSGIASSFTCVLFGMAYFFVFEPFRDRMVALGLGISAGASCMTGFVLTTQSSGHLEYSIVSGVLGVVTISLLFFIREEYEIKRIFCFLFVWIDVLWLLLIFGTAYHNYSLFGGVFLFSALIMNFTEWLQIRQN